ncbi:MAG: protoporphyrinogen oxidase [Nitrospirota bacterium]
MRLIIIGGGISGLSLAYFLLEQNPSLDLTVLESEKKAGGKIWTDKADGFLCEGGVNGFLDNRPRTLELVSKLSLTPLRSSDKARKRFIFSDKKLHRLPESPLAFLTSGLLSLPGRLRVVGEMFVPKGGSAEETLAEFARRRLGREAYEKLIDPMASGIFAGDPNVMSLKSCFPKVYNLEQKYGSLIRGMIKMQNEAKKTGKKVGAGPGGILTSFYDGMGSMIESLTNILGDRLKTGAKVVAVDTSENRYVVHCVDGTALDSDLVVLASPAHEAKGIVNSLDENLASVLGEIVYPAVSVVCLGYKRDKIRHPLDGFGFLIPNRERRKILGTLWDSSIFPNRAPEGYVLLRSMLGGARMSDLALIDKDRLVRLVMAELKATMGIRVEPDFSRVYTHGQGIPQYSPDHEKRLERIDGIMKRFKGMYITGNAYRGIGVNDCVENSYNLALRVREENL